MSGFAAIIALDGSAAEPHVLERMTAAVAAFAPDGVRTFTDAEVAMSQCLLATSPGETLPAVEAVARLLVAGDVRLDARDTLAAALNDRGWPDASIASTDLELIGRAYRAWGTRCVEHLMGDYAFVIYDRDARTTFCARDPFGVKLAFYARTTNAFVLSSSIDAVRAHPAVSARLNERTIGDFLLLGVNTATAETTFADIAALPAAHTLTVREGVVETRRYWSPPDDLPEIRYADPREYVAHFRALLDAAVADRLPAGRSAVLMSGGVDSSMLACVARRRGADVVAITHGFESLFVDPEPRVAASVARHLEIPHWIAQVDDRYLRWDWMRGRRVPEPTTVAVGTGDHAFAAMTDCRVALTGFDGDALLSSSLAAHWRELLRRGRVATIGRELAWHAAARRWPRIGWRTAWQHRRRRTPPSGLPSWIEREFADRTGLHDRWRSAQAWYPERAKDCHAPARASLASEIWRTLGEEMDPSATHALVEHRHPLLDLRIVNFALALPPVPWCVDKGLFREAFHDELPRAVIDRPKTPLAGDPAAAAIARHVEARLEPAETAAAFREFVNVDQYNAAAASAVARGHEGQLAWRIMYAYSLDAWLRGETAGAGLA